MYSFCMLTCEVPGETSEFQTLQTGRIETLVILGGSMMECNC
jgi:hypothetical protein